MVAIAWYRRIRLVPDERFDSAAQSQYGCLKSSWATHERWEQNTQCGAGNRNPGGL
jgi:hypothetical protein